MRILIVDDFEEWRVYLCSFLQGCPGLELIGEAVDGLEAIEKNKQLRPDLILIDNSMPKLNGVDTIKRLCQTDPKAKILSISISRSSDIAQAAIDAGAAGYICKLDVESKLLPAIAELFPQK